MTQILAYAFPIRFYFVTYLDNRQACRKYTEKNRLIGFVKTGQHATTRYDVSLKPNQTGSIIKWEQEITSLDKHGDLLLDNINESVYNEKMGHINKLLEYYLLHGGLMNDHEFDDRYLKRLVGENDAEEVTQTVFERVSRNLGSFQKESKLSTWLYRIATNAALDKLKSSSYKHSPVGALAPFPIHSPEMEGCVSSSSRNQMPPDKRVIREEMSECVREFIDRLPPDYRTIITLNEIEGFTNVEIAEILQISLDTAKIRLHRARAKLKRNLEVGCDFYLDERSELACDRKQPAKKQELYRFPSLFSYL